MTTMLRLDDWKLIVWHGSPASGNPREGELYNLAEDPNELYNLFHEPAHGDVRRRMKGALLDVMAETEDRTACQVRSW